MPEAKCREKTLEKFGPEPHGTEIEIEMVENACKWCWTLTVWLSNGDSFRIIQIYWGL